ncbi:MAG: RNA polymerase-binding protein DksA [Epsilonproteobacteria bacterium]|nr:MAG: RNA polymerase-binding protein DksA [Campylobacterota bacterium]
MPSSKQINDLKEMLIKRRDVIQSNIDDNIDNISKLNDCDCKDDLDFAEASSDSFTAGVIVNQQKQELKEINEAIESIKNKTYGICEMCDEIIAIGRLKAKPFAKFCTDCREIHEHNHN